MRNSQRLRGERLCALDFPGHWLLGGRNRLGLNQLGRLFGLGRRRRDDFAQDSDRHDDFHGAAQQAALQRPQRDNVEQDHTAANDEVAVELSHRRREGSQAGPLV